METWMQKEPTDSRNDVAEKYKHGMRLKATDITDEEWDEETIGTLKYDGELSVAFVNVEGDEVVFANRYYRLRTNMEIGNNLVDLIGQHKPAILSAVIVGELYAVGDDESKLSLGEVMHRIKKPSNAEEEASIRFAAFDIIELNGEKWTNPYHATIEKLETLLGHDHIAHVAKSASGPEGMHELWDEVIAEGLEGIVARSPTIGNRKVKQKFDVDLAVIGITTSGKSWDRGEAPALMLAFMDEDGTYRYGGTAGGGLRPGPTLGRGGAPVDYRAWWFDEAHKEDLGIMRIGNKMVKMMKPKHVVTITADDWVIAERPTLEFNNGDWTLGVEFAQAAVGQKPRITKYRADKSKGEINQQDIRLEQIPEMIQ